MSAPVSTARPARLAPSRALERAALGDPSGRSRTSALLRFTCFALFFFPSTMVIKPIGASGTVPLLLAVLLLAVWLVSALWGLHDPFEQANPLRVAAAILVLGVLVCFGAMQGGWTPTPSGEGAASAQRWVIFVFASLGVVLVVTDSIRSIADALALSRWLLAGGFFSCLVGVIQFVFHINPMEWVQAAMPGFTYNGGDTPFQQRGALVRVAGSTFHSIEFAVTSSMLLPLSIWRAINDPRGRLWFHLLQTALLVFAVASTVSRSGALAVLVLLVIFVPALPRRVRRWVLAALPVAVLALFLLVPGFVGTLGSALTATSSDDPSLSTRVNNYPRVAALIDQNPLFGTGPGTYLPTNALHILDNEYLNAAVSMGYIGAACVAIYLIAPGVAMIIATVRARAEALRGLAGAIAAALAVGAVCSATFDSLSFPVFALLFPIMVGLGGAVWRLVARETLLDHPGAVVAPLRKA